MCGIIAYLGSEPYNEYIISGLKLLQNRGYDSVGFSCIEDGQLHTIKYASVATFDSLERLETTMKTNPIASPCAIGHTRWATHGGKTEINAHPHSDNCNRISLVHNGIIENFHELKTQLLNHGYSFKSQTDTEVISVLIGSYLDAGEPIEKSIQKTVEELTGTWALVIIHCDYPNKMWITRNGSPLLLGIDDEFIMVASEQIAFGNYIQKYIVLNNHDLIEISKEDLTIKYNINISHYSVKEKDNTVVELTPKGYKNWMLKEIMEQPETIIRALNNYGRIESNVSVKLGGLDSHKNQLLDINHVILLGCGTSYNAGLWSLDIFKNLNIFETVSIYDGAEFKIGDIPKKGKCGVILLSQSGETKDLHRCIQIAKDRELISIGVVNVVDSLIARETDCGCYLNAGLEVAVASTKSFTNQCIVLSMIAVWFSQNRGTCIEKRKKIIIDLRNIAFQFQNVLKHIQTVDSVAYKLKEAKSLFILGKGNCEAIAREGALKLKEIAYIHAEGCSSSALKHGPFALIEDGLPIIILDIGEEYRDKNRNAFQEVLARNANVIRITDIYSETELSVDNSTFSGLLANVYIQYISYRISVLNGSNPDFPRNLAKVVTVE
jgi:glucosamine--fructose-6-phosphate aminotransferase (isomerizing)